MQLWCLKTGKQLCCPDHPLHRGSATVLAWCTGKADPWDTLLFGTSAGYLVFWQFDNRSVRHFTFTKFDFLTWEQETFQEISHRQVGNGSEISSVASEASDGEDIRVASMSSDGAVQLWSLNRRNRELRADVSIILEKTIPRCIFFDPPDNNVLVFGRVCGNA